MRGSLSGGGGGGIRALSGSLEEPGALLADPRFGSVASAKVEIEGNVRSAPVASLSRSLARARPRRSELGPFGGDL